ncbi:transcription factor 23 [Suncus etruscus]|uniref:transcription factor 23 n=1 Tax=Suncus etruscus TaxID=109475 RepID=UPI00210F57D9|nr:transcription factor 23 [Suncus etruscus]
MVGEYTQFSEAGKKTNIARGVPPMPKVGCSLAPTKPQLLAGLDKKKGRPSQTRQDMWEDASWNPQRWSRVAPNPRGARLRSRSDIREASPESAAQERSRVWMLRRAFLALQAALPTVPPHTKLSRLDVLLLAASYIAHLTRALGCELPGPTWTPCLPGLRYLHPLKKWPMRSRLYMGSLDTIIASIWGPRTEALTHASTPSPAHGDQ